MFTHQQTSDRFNLYTLKNEKGTLIEVVPERGAIISRFDVEGQQVFPAVRREWLACAIDFAARTHGAEIRYPMNGGM